MDAYLTHFIAETILDNSDKKQRKLIQVYLQSADVVAEIELRGMRFDKMKCDTIKNFIMNKMTKMENNIYVEAKEQFNLNASSEVAKVYFFKYSS